MRQNRSFTELDTPQEIAAQIGDRARQLRLARELRQTDVAARARVSVATLQRFESTGVAAFSAVLRIATVLGAEAGIRELFAPPSAQSLEELGIDTRASRKRAPRREALP